jgi:hypothetical protein
MCRPRSLDAKTRLASLHEASHAVVARVLGLDVESVALLGTDGYEGQTIVESGVRMALDCGADDELMHGAILADMLVAAAGGVCDQLYTREGAHDAASLYVDDRVVWSLAHIASDSLDQAIDDVAKIRNQAARIVLNNWREIRRIAHALLVHGHLSGDEVDAIRLGET